MSYNVRQLSVGRLRLCLSTCENARKVTPIELTALHARFDEVRQLAAAIDVGGLGDPGALAMVRTALAARMRLYEGQLANAKEAAVDDTQGRLL